MTPDGARLLAHVFDFCRCRPPADAGQQKLSAGTEQLVSVHAAAEQGPWPPADAEQQPWQTSVEVEQLPVEVLLITSSLSVGQGG